MAKKNDEVIEQKDEEIIIDAKPQAQNSTKKKCAVNEKVGSFFRLKMLPITLAFISICLTLISQFFSVVTAFVTARIFFALSIVVILGSLVILTINYIKDKNLKLNFSYLVIAFAILLLCI